MALRRFTGLVLSMGLTTVATAAMAAEPPAADPSKEVQIHFANLGGIQDWRADGNKALYIQGRNKKWYRAELMSPCTGLNFTDGIGFVTEPNGSFDKFSAVMVEHRECPVTSLVESDGPPKKDSAKKDTVKK